jgi:hypothetical protein
MGTDPCDYGGWAPHICCLWAGAAAPQGEFSLNPRASGLWVGVWCPVSVHWTQDTEPRAGEDGWLRQRGLLARRERAVCSGGLTSSNAGFFQKDRHTWKQGISSSLGNPEPRQGDRKSASAVNPSEAVPHWLWCLETLGLQGCMSTFHKIVPTYICVPSIAVILWRTPPLCWMSVCPHHSVSLYKWTCTSVGTEVKVPYSEQGTEEGEGRGKVTMGVFSRWLSEDGWSGGRASLSRGRLESCVGGRQDLLPVSGWHCPCVSEPGQTVGRRRASCYLLFSHRVCWGPVPAQSRVTNCTSQSKSKGFRNIGSFSQFWLLMNSLF